MQRILDKWIFRQVDIAPLVSFRILFGALMAIGMTRFWIMGWVDRLYIEPIHFFKFYGFNWVPVPAGGWIYVINGIAVASALFISIGFLYRISTITFFLSFTYLELMDATNYLNHYYLVVLFSFMLILLPAHRMHSLDLRLGWVKPLNTVPAVAVNILRAQMVVVYTFAGIAKLNSDWLFRAMPLRVWLPEHTGIPIVGPLLSFPFVAYVFSWFGAVYDLSIGYFMLFKGTRRYAYIFVVLFHVITGSLFNIGLFPVIMIFCTTTFFSADTHRKWHERMGMKRKNSEAQITYHRWLKPVVLAYLFIQVIFPFRHILYPGSVLVTEEGYRFSWRVMLVEKAGTATFRIMDKKTGRMSEIMNSDYLTSFQEKQMAIQPDFMLQYARIIAEDYAEKVEEPAIYVDSYVTLNGRVSTRYIDPEVDLLTVNDNWRSKEWILPKKFTDFK